jgi:hypothetical protein
MGAWSGTEIDGFGFLAQGPIHVPQPHDDGDSTLPLTLILIISAIEFRS